MQKFYFSHTIEYQDTDLSGVLYHANYLHLADRARCSALRSLMHQIDNLLRFAVYKLNIIYSKPIKFNDHLIIDTSLSELKKASFTWQQNFIVADHLCATLEVQLVSINNNLQLIAIPNNVYHLLQAVI